MNSYEYESLYRDSCEWQAKLGDIVSIAVVTVVSSLGY